MGVDCWFNCVFLKQLWIESVLVRADSGLVDFITKFSDKLVEVG